jgi:hypothetical protein
MTQTNRNKVFKAWLKCKVTPCRNKNNCEVEVKGLDNKTVKHIICTDRIHKSNKYILVIVFKDKDGYWIRFPTTSPYRPFRVPKNKLRKVR